MFNNSITFDELPGAVSSLVNLVRELANEVRELRAQLTSERNNTKSNSRFIGIPEACEILGKAKSTVYRLANEGKVPAYKVPGEKEWRFIESELVAHVKENKRQSSILSPSDRSPSWTVWQHAPMSRRVRNTSVSASCL